MNINLTIFVILFCLMSVFGIVLAWSEPFGVMPNDKILLNTSSVSQYKEGDLYFKKIVSTDDNDYFLDLDNTDLSANFGGAIQMGNLFLACEESVEGAVRYNSEQKNLQICINSEWKNLQSEIIEIIEMIGDHSYEECIDNGGAMVKVSEGNLCFYSGKTCPSEWVQYKRYSSTYSVSGQGCSVYYDKYKYHTTCPCIPSPACWTGSHLYQNRAPETCTSRGYYRAGDSGCYKYTLPRTVTAVAVVYQVGCY